MTLYRGKANNNFYVYGEDHLVLQYQSVYGVYSRPNERWRRGNNHEEML